MMLAKLSHIVVLVTALATSLAANAAVTWTAEPLNPPAVPLAVRSPYLSAWLQQGDGQPLNGVWPSFWTGTVCSDALLELVYEKTLRVRWKTLGWAGFIRVDGTAYSFLGDPSLDSGVQKAVQKSFKVGYSSIDCVFRILAFMEQENWSF